VNDAVHFFPLWRMSRQSATTVNLLILNHLSASNWFGFMASDAGVPCVERPYLFALTCEKSPVEKGKENQVQHFDKLRVMVIRREVLLFLHVAHCLRTAEPFASEPCIPKTERPTNRLETLHAMGRLAFDIGRHPRAPPKAKHDKGWSYGEISLSVPTSVTSDSDVHELRKRREASIAMTKQDRSPQYHYPPRPDPRP